MVIAERTQRKEKPPRKIKEKKRTPSPFEDLLALEIPGYKSEQPQYGRKEAQQDGKRQITLDDGTIIQTSFTKGPNTTGHQEPDRIHTTVSRKEGNINNVAATFTITPRGLTQLYIPAVAIEIKMGRETAVMPSHAVDFQVGSARFSPETSEAFRLSADRFVKWTRNMISQGAFSPPPFRLGARQH